MGPEARQGPRLVFASASRDGALPGTYFFEERDVRADDEVVVRMRPGAGLRGRATPTEPGTVSLRVPDRDGGPLWTTELDEEGRFELAGLPPDTRLEAWSGDERLTFTTAKAGEVGEIDLR